MSELKKYYHIAESFSQLLYPFAEVVIHDLKTNKISAIYNNFSKRSPGDDSDIENPEAFQYGSDKHGPFINDDFYGRRIKYTTSVLRNDKGIALGLLCINIDLEDFLSLQNSFNMFLNTSSDSKEFDDLFDDNWQEKIRSYVQNFQKEKNQKLSNFSKEDKIELIKSLQKAGAFKAKNAATFTANILGVSRATIYNYLAKINNN